jgi:hypothetical protein
MNRELLLMSPRPPLSNENGATEVSKSGNYNRGPKDPPSDQSTYQDPSDDEDVLDEGPSEPDDDEENDG